MKSFLNSDLYKFTMNQAVWKHYSSAWVKYKFHCRTKGVDLRPYRAKIEAKIAAMHGVGPTAEEIEFLRQQGYFDPSYLSMLSQARLNTNYIHIGEENGHLTLEIEGPWEDTIYFEVPVLGAINEAYFEDRDSEALRAEGDRRLSKKINTLHAIHPSTRYLPDIERHPFKLMEFGTRRAFSTDWQDHVVARLTSELPEGMLSGCSNVYLAKKYNLVPQGTMAHEYIMAHAAFVPLQEAQRVALYTWNDVYRGRLGIALSDTFTFDQFLRDFDLALASLFTGARHDSGDPFVWGEKLVAHYEKLGINPYTKTGAWTDGLDITTAYQIWRKFSYRIRCVFGIGTNLTNDLGLDPLSIVIKMTHCNGMPLIKISDEPAKAMCLDPQFKAWAVHYFTEVAPLA